MSTYIDTFKRKEVKYRLSARQRAEVEALLSGSMQVDGYGKSTVTSVYLDTPTHELIERSLEKPLYKEKIRVRVYGTATPQASDTAFIEIKKKYKGIVYKRRVSCTFGQAMEYLKQARTPKGASPRLADQIASGNARSAQILREIDYFMRHYDRLAPAMVVSCKRVALTPSIFSGQDSLPSKSSAENPFAALGTIAQSSLPGSLAATDLRVTFDTDIVCRDLSRGANDSQLRVLDYGESIMEIKVPKSYPLWLAEGLSACEVYPSSFSKYGEAYKMSMAGHQDIRFSKGAHCA